jgi:hypothetical protein
MVNYLRMKHPLTKYSIFLLLIFLSASTVIAQTKKHVGHLAESKENMAYLFTYFTGNSKAEEAIRFAVSNDGYHYKALNNNNPIVSSEKSVALVVFAIHIFCVVKMAKPFIWWLPIWFRQMVGIQTEQWYC